ncbi:hypothetical protein GPECTOR_33g674 [Gonium pectorale]|uniref:ERD4 protein n=1 Tax=Gonium pectorale TaxID=33097 RepID=A0A150GD78_GONPE|nr:hypothetical protein GPECTOR_33g674 [Gonium pectorale]|eukprot:KXZ47792.1 hypothetical protein GPECTOR_33g674 [Gonium pectorale]
MAAGSAAVLSSFTLNLIIAACCFFGFSVVRPHAWCRRFFAPRRWIWPVLTYKEEDIIDEAGLDCAMYLRILRFGLYLFTVLSIGCVAIILPINLTSSEVNRLLHEQETNNSTSQEYKFTDFDRYSLSNVSARSPKMWAHLVCMYFVVLFTLWLLNRFNRESVLLRLMFLGNGKRGGPSHTVLVTDIPAISQHVAKAKKEARKAAREARKTVRKAQQEEKKAKKAGNGRNVSKNAIHSDVEAQAKDTNGATAAPSPEREADTDKIAEPEKPPGDMTGEEMLSVLQTIQPEEDDPEGTAGPGAADAAEKEPETTLNRRKTKRFKYDLKDERLDSVYQAKQHLKSGLTPEEMVTREFIMMYSPQQVAAVNLVPNTAELEPLVAEYDKLRMKLEDYLDMLQLRLRLRKGVAHKTLTVLGATYGDWGKETLGTRFFKKVDAVDFWIKRLKYLRERIIAEQKHALQRVVPSAFVTFNTRTAQAVGANTLHSHDVNNWRVHVAPAPFEVVWKNLGMTTPMKTGRLYILWAAFWAMTLFFMIPVTAIQALIEVPKLANIPVLGTIVTLPGIRQILEAIVPGLALKLFLILVPIVLRHMAILSGTMSISEIDFGVVSRYFLFQVIVVFFGNIIAGSFFNQITQWVKSPTGVIPTLGKSIPMTSTFFITFLFTNGMGVKALSFLRLVGFIIYYLLHTFAGSPRARQRLWMYQYTNNGTTVVDHTIAILIGLTFSCINPIVCPAALAYFLVTFLGESYNNIYVFRREYESAGRLWQTVYNQVMVGLYIMQLTMLGLLGIKSFPYTVLGFPLLILSVICHIGTLNTYRRPWSVTALHDAGQLDAWEATSVRTRLFLEAKKERRRPVKQVAEGDGGATTEGTEGTKAAEKPATVVGPSEARLRAVLQDQRHAFALTPEEQAEVSRVYKNPAFKVRLDDLEEVEALAKDVLPRIDVLNEWLAQLKKAGKKPAPAALTRRDPESQEGTAEKCDAEQLVSEVPPPEVTKYDDKPPLDGEDETER